MPFRLFSETAKRWRAWLLARRPRGHPARIAAREVYILPTGAGVAAALALAAMWVASINYGLALGHALTYFLVAVGVVSLFQTQRSLVDLEIAARPAQPVFAGEPLVFLLSVRELRGRARFALRIRGDGLPPINCALSAWGETTLRLSTPTTHRGWLEMPPLVIETEWPFGFARAWTYVALPVRGLVYPKPAENPPPAPRLPGRETGVARGEEDFAGLSDHRPGEPLPRVAWKASARLEEGLLAKRFAGGESQILWLDWQALPSALDKETRLAWLARWALDAERARLAWGLVLPTIRLAPGSGPEHLAHTLSALALYD
ncbi:MAG: DUF58 domain-containing protein [Rhodocyclaceae bacterium]|nr:DUF58 domain-containing protein [Rhodocyclaceae bacterium]